jgi:hypothetical protein
VYAPLVRSSTLLCLLLAAACASGKGAARSGEAPKITADCKLVMDGATCSFANAGGPGADCVHVLYGVKASSTVVASDEVCSGRLGKGATRLVAVRFPRRPGELCAGDLGSCQVRVIAAANADRLASDWQRELSVERKPRPEDCDGVARHVFDVFVATQLAELDEEARETARAEYEGMWDSVRADLVQTCKDQMPREAIECVMNASTLEEIDQCAAKD